MSNLESNRILLEILDSRTSINSKTGCWEYIGRLNRDGYGILVIDGIQYLTHRLSASIYLNLDLNNLNLCALHKLICSNRHCWNPDHLYVGTQVDNMRDKSVAGTARNQNSDKTHCHRGHEFTEENTLIRHDKDGICHRRCRKCGSINMRERRMRMVDQIKEAG